MAFVYINTQHLIPRLNIYIAESVITRKKVPVLDDRHSTKCVYKPVCWMAHCSTFYWSSGSLDAKSNDGNEKVTRRAKAQKKNSQQQLYVFSKYKC